MGHDDLGTLFRNMHPDELSELLEKLVLYAAVLLRSHGPKARHYDMDAEAVAHEAITRALNETRKWPKGLEPKIFLFGVVKSIVSHLGNGPDHVSIDGGADDDGPSGGVLELPSGQDVEAEVVANIVREEFRQKLEPELRDYVDLCERYSGSTAEELAEKSGKTVKQIRNYDRRLARRRAQWNSR